MAQDKTSRNTLNLGTGEKIPAVSHQQHRIRLTRISQSALGRPAPSGYGSVL